MNKRDFEKLIEGTKFGKKGAKSLDAARLYFVGGNTNVSACAAQAGCSKQSASVTIKNIETLIEKRGMETIVVTLPKGKRREFNRLVKQLQNQVPS